MSQRFDCIVLGVGAMGSSTTYDLSVKRGKKVLGLEKFDIPHAEGSSHGINRMIRLAYYEDTSYVPLMRRSYELWEEIQAVAGEQLLFRIGSIDTAPAGHEVFEGSLESCLVHDIPHEVLNHKQMNQRFPGYEMPPGQMGLFQADGGFVLAERSIIAYVNASLAAGADIRARETVLNWEATGDGVRVFTDRAEYTAEKLVITVGAWAAGVIPSFEKLAVPERQVVAWFQPDDPSLFTPDRFPVFNAYFEEGRYYGFPIFGIPGFKIGRYHHFEEVVDPDHFDKTITREDEETLRVACARYFPRANGSVMTMATCLFTNSPDDHFIIGVLPDHPQVSVATGFSGHGFKFASVVGEIMGDLVTKGETRHDIELLRLDRF